MERFKQLVTKHDPEYFKRLLIYCVENEMTIQELTERAYNDYFQRRGVDIGAAGYLRNTRGRKSEV